MLKNKISLSTLFIILVIIAGIEIAGLFCHSSPPPQENDTAGPAIFTPIFSNTTRGLECITDWLGTNSDAVTALATIAIALFTWTLWRATTGLLKTANNQAADNLRAIKASEKSAKAAKDSADALKAIERARLFVRVEHIQRGELKRIDGIQEGPNEIRVIVINEGKSLATITKFNWYMVAIDDGEIKGKIAELESLQTSMIPVITIRGNDAVKRIFSFEINKSDVQMVDISTAHYYCLGYIRYKDVFRDVRPITFCWKDEGSYFSRDPEHSTDA